MQNGMSRLSKLLIVGAASCIGLVFLTSWGMCQTPDNVRPHHVFAHVQWVQEELDLIRLEMGKPLDLRPDINVIRVSPHEVFFQAITLFNKANRLSLEKTKQWGTTPSTPKGNIRPANVYHVVDQALQKILEVKQHFKIPETVDKPEVDPIHTPVDVFREIVQANRQLNILLDTKYGPHDVFQQVGQARNYLQVLMKNFSDTNRELRPPEFERRISPKQVYRSVYNNFQTVRAIYLNSGLAPIELEIDTTISVTPSDVYDLASLVVSQLDFLYRQSKASEAPKQFVYPGSKLPAHVYQHTGWLQKDLEALNDQVLANPQWLD